MASFNVGSIFVKIGMDDTSFARGAVQVQHVAEKMTSVVNKSFQTLKKTSNKTFTTMFAPMKALKRGLQGVAKAVGGLTRSFFSLRNIVVGVATSFAGMQLMKTAERASEARMAFTQLAQALGSTADDALGQLRSALKGTVSDLDIMQQVSNAAILGVGDNIEDMAEIFGVARRLGQATGRTATEAVGDIVVGIGRQSRLILDNIGLIVKVDKANEDYARKLGITKEELTDVDKRQAFLNATLDAGREAVKRIGEEQETFAVSFQRMAASIKNFGVALSVRLSPAMKEFLDSITGFSATRLQDSIVFLLERSLNNISQWVRNNSYQIQSFLNTTAELIVRIAEGIRKLTTGAANRLLDIISDPGKAVQFFANTIANALSLWAGIGQLVVAGILGALDSEKATLKNFFTFLGSVFARAFEPLGALLDTFLKNVLDVLPEDLRASIQNRRERPLRQMESERLQLKQQLDQNDSLIRLLRAQVQSGQTKTIRGVSRSPEQALAVMNSLERNKEINLKALQALNELIESEKLSLSAPSEVMKAVTEKNVSRAEAMLESGVKSLGATFDGVLKNLFGTDRSGLTASMTKMLQEFREQLNEDTDESFWNFATPSPEVLTKARKDLDSILGMAGEDIARSFERGEIESLTLLTKSLNNLMADRKEIQRDTNALDSEKLDALQEIEQIEIAINAIVEARSVLNKQAVENEEKQKEAKQATETAEDMLAQTEEQRAQLIAQRDMERLAGLERINAEEQAVYQAMERNLDRLNIQLGREDQIREKILSVLQQTFGIQRDLTASQAEVSQEQQLQTLERRLAVVQATALGEEAVDAVRRQQYIDEQTNLGLSEDAIERLLVNYDNIVKKQKEITEEQEKQARFNNVFGNLGEALFDAARTGEDAFKSFTRSFISDFQKQTKEGLQELANKFADQLGKGVSNFFGSGAFSAILGLVGMLTSQRSSSTVTEVPSDEIVGSSTQVRGVVAGPQSVAINEIGSSIREANRGVERLLTDIRNILQSIEGGGLNSGGLGAAGLV